MADTRLTTSDDTFTGTSGADTILGGFGDDIIRGGKGDDIIDGGNGDDRLRGDEGEDILRGGNGRDTLFGGSGNDTIRGDEGDDILFGNSGNDTLTGGGGDDIFAWVPADFSSSDLDTIVDFQQGMDSIQISGMTLGSTITTVTAGRQYAIDVNNDGVVDVNIKFGGPTPINLTAADFGL